MGRAVAILFLMGSVAIAYTWTRRAGPRYNVPILVSCGNQLYFIGESRKGETGWEYHVWLWEFGPTLDLGWWAESSLENCFIVTSHSSDLLGMV